MAQNPHQDNSNTESTELTTTASQLPVSPTKDYMQLANESLQASNTLPIITNKKEQYVDNGMVVSITQEIIEIIKKDNAILLEEMKKAEAKSAREKADAEKAKRREQARRNTSSTQKRQQSQNNTNTQGEQVVKELQKQRDQYNKDKTAIQQGSSSDIRNTAASYGRYVERPATSISTTPQKRISSNESVAFTKRDSKNIARVAWNSASINRKLKEHFNIQKEVSTNTPSIPDETIIRIARTTVSAQGMQQGYSTPSNIAGSLVPGLQPTQRDNGILVGIQNASAARKVVPVSIVGQEEAIPTLLQETGKDFSDNQQATAGATAGATAELKQLDTAPGSLLANTPIVDAIESFHDTFKTFFRLRKRDYFHRQRYKVGNAIKGLFAKNSLWQKLTNADFQAVGKTLQDPAWKDRKLGTARQRTNAAVHLMGGVFGKVVGTAGTWTGKAVGYKIGQDARNPMVRALDTITEKTEEQIDKLGEIKQVEEKIEENTSFEDRSKKAEIKKENPYAHLGFFKRNFLTFKDFLKDKTNETLVNHLGFKDLKEQKDGNPNEITFEGLQNLVPPPGHHLKTYNATLRLVGVTSKIYKSISEKSKLVPGSEDITGKTIHLGWDGDKKKDIPLPKQEKKEGILGSILDIAKGFLGSGMSKLAGLAVFAKGLGGLGKGLDGLLKLFGKGLGPLAGLLGKGIGAGGKLLGTGLGLAAGKLGGGLLGKSVGLLGTGVTAGAGLLGKGVVSGGKLLGTGVTALAGKGLLGRAGSFIGGGADKLLGKGGAALAGNVATTTAVAKTGGGFLSKALTAGKGLLGTAGTAIAGSGLTGKALTAGKGLLGKIGGKVATKAGGKAAGKALLKGAGKSFLKKVPLLGAAAGLVFAGQRALKGDFTGASLELASGLASTMPGAGTGASVALDVALAARDMKKAKDAEKEAQNKEFAIPGEKQAQQVISTVSEKAKNVADSVQNGTAAAAVTGVLTETGKKITAATGSVGASAVEFGNNALNSANNLYNKGKEAVPGVVEDAKNATAKIGEQTSNLAKQAVANMPAVVSKTEAILQDTGSWISSVNKSLNNLTDQANSTLAEWREKSRRLKEIHDNKLAQTESLTKQGLTKAEIENKAKTVVVQPAQQVASTGGREATVVGGPVGSHMRAGTEDTLMGYLFGAYGYQVHLG